MANEYPMISFRCDRQLQKAVEKEARQRDISIGELIRQALAQHLEKNVETTE
jgi:predicted HicB family RNase H-like nuclease